MPPARSPRDSRYAADTQPWRVARECPRRTALKEAPATLPRCRPPRARRAFGVAPAATTERAARAGARRRRLVNACAGPWERRARRRARRDLRGRRGGPRGGARGRRVRDDERSTRCRLCIGGLGVTAVPSRAPEDAAIQTRSRDARRRRRACHRARLPPARAPRAPRRRRRPERARPSASHYRRSARDPSRGARVDVVRKPSSVPRAGRPARGGDHSSRARRCRAPRAANPQARASHPSDGELSPRRTPAYAALLPMGFAVPRALPRARWALTPPFHPYLPIACEAETGGLFLCGTFLGVLRHRALPGIVLCGARTFLPSRPYPKRRRRPAIACAPSAGEGFALSTRARATSGTMRAQMTRSRAAR